MARPKRRGAPLAAIACIAFAAGTARGASITETVPFTILASNAANLPAQTVDVSTPEFNPSLGTLVSATTIISGTANTALEFFSTGGGGRYDILLTDTLNLAGIPSTFGQELTGVVSADQRVLTLPVAFAFGPVERSDPAELVVGSSMWNQLFSLPFPSIAVKQSPASVIDPGLSVTGSSVTTYTYISATAVPEPRFPLVAALLSALALGSYTWRPKRVKTSGQSIRESGPGLGDLKKD